MRLVAFPVALGLSLALVVLAGCLSRSLTGLTVSPAAGSVTVSAGQTTQFQAQGSYTESGHATTSQNMTNSVSWQSSNPAVATINSSGLATGVTAGTATITANMAGQFGPVSATSDITVTGTGGGTILSRVLTSLLIIPGSQTVSTTDEATQFIAVGTYSSGTPATQDLTDLVSWQSSDVKVAQVNDSGLVTGVGAGQSTISALATNSDGSVTTATATFTEASTTLPATLPALTINPVGAGAGSVTGIPLTGPGVGNTVIDCTYSGFAASGTCVGNSPVGTVVMLMSTPGSSPASQFDGWSANCALTPPSPQLISAQPTAVLANYCYVTMSNDEHVGAIFDPTNP